jgi:hypothetical protein
MSEYILIVEGEADRGFFELLCNKLELGVTVKVQPPKELGISHNTKEGAFKALKACLELMGVAGGGVEKLAIVVDADAAENGTGFARTLRRVEKIVSEYGFSAPTAATAGGCLFQHSDGLNPFGLWIMPNHADDGMLEHWLSECVSQEQIALFHHAQACVDALPTRLFKPLRRAKADIATWLAWQEKPGEGLYHCVEAGLLDETAQQYQALVSWLRAVFSPT